ncbi:MAG: AMP-binding protein [Acidobacteriia bacterium]|nr:AMP-binding protein [Terriglobia bacterium]
MLGTLRKAFERTIIGDSVPALVRWGKHVPRSVIRGIQEDGFRDLIRYAAARQKFFARKLREKGIDPSHVRRPEDLGDIFTTPEDLRNLPAEDFLCRKPHLVFETTGTSGGPKRVYFTYDELEFTARYEAAAMYENGVRPGDRVVCTFDAGYWISSWVTFCACKRLEVFCSAIGKPHPREAYSRMGLYRYNVIAADPTWLVSLSEIAEKEGTFPVKLILAAGDRMTDVYREYVESIWKCPVILGYGSTEQGGGAGMECQRRDGIHLDEYNFWFEILEPDAEGYGELVVTTLSRRTMPLIRYRVHDVTRWIEDPCPCGATIRRVARIKGRRDEMVVMGAGNMYPEIFERVLHDVAGISENWQVAARQEGLHDILEFRLELSNGISTGTVEQKVRENLKARFPDVWANQDCGMYRLAFRFLPPGSLSQGRKPKRLVDERNS